MKNENLQLVKKLVAIKIKELETYVKVRYFIEENQVTKISFEGHKIAEELNNGNYNTNFQQSYLKILKDEIISGGVKIIEYRPNEDYNGTQDLINWIDRQLIKFEQLKKSEHTKENTNPHPSTFEDGAFNIFVKWINNSNEKQVKSISFIFQKLKKENKLRNTTFKVLSEWAYDNNYLDEENYNKLLINGCFISPSKILTKTRLALYNSINSN